MIFINGRDSGCWFWGLPLAGAPEGRFSRDRGGGAVLFDSLRPFVSAADGTGGPVSRVTFVWEWCVAEGY